MSSDYKNVLGDIRAAYVQLQSGALRSTLWKREGASSYTIQRRKTSPKAGAEAALVDQASKRKPK